MLLLKFNVDSSVLFNMNSKAAKACVDSSLSGDWERWWKKAAKVDRNSAVKTADLQAD